MRSSASSDHASDARASTASIARGAGTWRNRGPSTEPIRTLFAFDPRRTAILLIGGKPGGDDRWRQTYVPLADRLHDEHLEELRKEGLI